MPKKQPKVPASEQLDNLLRAFALRRLQKGSPPTAKAKKPKRDKKR
jgi:hypothetical protein